MFYFGPFSPFKSTFVIAIIAVFVFSASACSRSGQSTEEKKSSKINLSPNIVMVVVDALRADHLMQYGYPQRTSPALDDLAKQATLFQNAYSASSWTVPSMASLFSGLLPPRHKTVRRGDSLNDKIQTLAESLQDNDYQTVGISYNHNITKKTSFDQGFDKFVEHKGRVLRYPDISKMLEDIEDWHDDYKQTQPFFMYLHPMNCHGPYKVPRPYRDNLLGRNPKPGFKYYDKIMGELMWRGKIENRSKVSQEYLESLTEKYDTAVRYTTDRLNEIFIALKDWDLWDDTMLIVTADHGEELYDHGGFSHGYTLYEEVIGIPLLIKMPYQKKSQTVETPVTLLDIYPTILEALDFDSEQQLDGQSILSMLKKGQYLTARFSNGEKNRSFNKKPLFFHLDWPSRGQIRSVRWKSDKLIEVKQDYSGLKDVSFLFDLKKDPAEKTNIIEKNPKLRKNLAAQLEAKWKMLSSGKLETPKNVLSEMDQEILKALGYME